MLYQSFDSQRDFQGEDFFKQICRSNSELTNNFKSGLTLRPYQEEALGRFIYYMESFQKKKKPVHLLFNMATGSGKTNIMAGTILYLYRQGYRNFIFFTRLDQIVAKTRINFLGNGTSKYAFADKIIVDNKEVNIREVRTFDGANPDDINILFSTTAGLHNQMLIAKENEMSLETIGDYKVVLLADEAHNLSVDTNKRLSGREELEVESWEKTVLRILKSNPESENILLEFTATARLDSGSQEIIEKYTDKALYKYSLKEYRADGYSKEVNTLQLDAPLMERVLSAVLISQYRLKIAEKNGLSIKPVILFKANRVNSTKGETSDWAGETLIFSNEFKQKFHDLIAGLEVSSIKKLEGIKDMLIQRALKHFSDLDDSYQSLIIELQLDFAETKCLTVDTDRNALEKQSLLNSLESRDNLIRAVFATESLNEGWDVLNLFDIVRLYDTRDSANNKAGKTTVQEAQLIGRGARYYPFALDGYTELDRRKFDSDITHEMRIIEEMIYHSKTNSRYIQELRQVLVREGLIAESTVERTVKVKDAIKKKDIWTTGLIFTNKREKNLSKGILSLADAKATFNENSEQNIYMLPTRIGLEGSLFTSGDIGSSNEGLQTLSIPLTDLGINVLRHALWGNRKGSFQALKNLFGGLQSLNDFLLSDDFLGNINVKVRGTAAQIQNLNQSEKVEIAKFVINRVITSASAEHQEYIGSKSFSPQKISHVFGKEKELRLDIDGTRKDLISNRYPHINLETTEWFAQNEIWGTDQEEGFIAFIYNSISELKSIYKEVVVFRNEMHFPIFSFENGEAFYPDFVLMLQKDSNDSVKSYQVFIEPKGDHLLEKDAWKEEFLLSISKIAKITFESDKYRLIGLPFFNKGEIDSALNENFAKEYKKLIIDGVDQ